jgi:precorrin-2 methylase
MSADSAEKEAVWDDVAAALAQEVAAGKQVGFITLGDAMLFSTWVFCCSGLAARTGWRLSLALPLSPPLPRGRKPRWPWSSSRWR